MPNRSRNIVLFSLVAMAVISIAADAAEGKTPAPKRFLALGFVAFFLFGALELAPAVASAFALVALAGVTLERGGPLATRFASVIAGGGSILPPPAAAPAAPPVSGVPMGNALAPNLPSSFASPKGAAIVKSARHWIGVPYLWGGESPNGFDCSGLVQYVLARNHITVPRVAAAQFAAGKPVSHPEPGDGVFFGSPVHHVGIVIGNGQMIDAPHTGALVRVEAYTNRTDIAGYRRFY